MHAHICSPNWRVQLARWHDSVVELHFDASLLQRASSLMSLSVCSVCHHILQDSGLAHVRPGYVEITCSDRRRFRQWSGNDVSRIIDVVVEAKRKYVAGEMNKTDMTEIVQVVGFNANIHGVMADPQLRAHAPLLDTVCWDWVHTALQDGFLTGEVALILEACGISRTTMQDWLQWDGWQFPKHRQTKGDQLHRIFSQYREVASDPCKIKANCSELLGLYGLLRHFIEVNVPEDAANKKFRESFIAACGVVDTLLDAKRSNRAPQDAASHLDIATAEYLEKHIAAYGTKGVKPKHHWMLDIPDQVRRSDCIIDAFVIERNHLLVKTVAEPVSNTSAFERSVLQGVLNVMCNDSDIAEGLRGRTAKLPGSADIVVADALRCFAVDIAVGDVVRCGDVFGLVQACVREAIVLAVTVTVLDVVCRPTIHHVKCKLNASRKLEIWSPADVCQCTAWYVDTGLVVILL